MAFSDDAAGDALADTELPLFLRIERSRLVLCVGLPWRQYSVYSYCADWLDAALAAAVAAPAALADCGEDEVADVNQFRRYGSRFVVVVVLLANADRLLDMPLLPVFVGVKPLYSGDAVGALPCTWALVNWIEPIPLPADATELIDAPTADAVEILCCGVPEYWLPVDHCDMSSSKISTQSIWKAKPMYGYGVNCARAMKQKQM